MSRLIVAWLLCTLSISWFTNAEAVDRQWSQLSGVHDFNVAGNWTPNGVPGAGDNLTFGLDGDVEVSLGAPSDANNIDFTDGSVELLGGGDLTVSRLEVGFDTSSTAELLVSGTGTTVVVNSVGSVGSLGTGLLTISDGALVRIDTLQISKEAPGDGTITVTGSSGGTPSTLEILNRIDLGDPDDSGGTSTLNINSGGLVSVTANNGFRLAGATGSTATINVSGAGSLLESDQTYLLGNQGNGIMNLNTGATATTANVVVGNRPSSTGAANVDGGGTNWAVAERLLVGEFGDGNLNVTGGGQVDANELFVGDGSSSTGAANVTIDGPASTVNVAETTNIGVTHAANLTVSGGGVLNASTGGDFDFNIDRSQQSLGGSVVNVDGAGSQINHQGTGTLNVGSALVGDAALAAQLNVTDGGTVTTTELDVALFGPSHGVVTVNGADSRIDARNNIKIGSQGTGTLNVENGGGVTAQNKVDISVFRTNGTATVTGVGSQLTAGSNLAVANFNNPLFNGATTGTLNIFDGGTVSNAGNGLIAGKANNVGTVNVGDGGATATWNNGDSLLVGGGNGNGSATLNVNAGGVVNVTNTLNIRNDATLTLDGGEINVDTLDIADPNDFNFNTGTLRLTGDETLDAAAYMQYFAGVANPTLGANQHLAVTGAATIAAPITINHATAALSVGSTGDLSKVTWNAGALNFTNQDFAIGTAGLLGSLITVNQNQALGVPNNRLEVQTLANLNVSGGGLTTGSAVNDGRIFISNATAIAFDADNANDGLINNEDLVIADSSVAGDILNFGDFDVAGNVTLADNLTLASGGSIKFLVGGVLPGEFGALSVSGDVELDGSLDVSFTGGFSLTEGDAFEIIDVAGALTGTYAGLPDGAAIGNFGGVDLFIDYDGGDGNDVVLFTHSDVDVDLDNDGDVDGRDFLLIQRTNPALISEWQAQYGSASPVNAFTGAVPEPATLWLTFGGVILVTFARRHSSASS